ncbi:MAG: hypothetical protein DRN61_03000, partial [Thaumarchaeota archaeon]
EARKKHFHDLKESCIRPLKNELTSILNCFTRFDEKLVTSGTYREILEREIKWWENYSIKRRIGDPILFDDLGRHFKGLPEKLREIEDFFEEKYPEFLNSLVELLQKIEADERLKEISNEIDRTLRGSNVVVVSDLPWFPFKAVFFLAIEYDKWSWPNIYKWLAKFESRSLIFQVGEEYHRSELAVRIRSLIKEAEHLITPCLERLDRILHESKLEGSCDYVSGLLPWP